MGSKSDMPVAEKAITILKKFNIEYDIAVASAHRTPARVEELVTGSKSDVFIAIAGLSAALPGSVAALTVKPVIGVPVSGALNLDAILSIVQLPRQTIRLRDLTPTRHISVLTDLTVTVPPSSRLVSMS